MTYLKDVGEATGATTAGRFGLYEWSMPPHAAGATPHFHKTFSESFYVVSGTPRLYDGTRWVDATLGSFLYVPEGGVHGFANESDEPASMLILFAPGTTSTRSAEHQRRGCGVALRSNCWSTRARSAVCVSSSDAAMRPPTPVCRGWPRSPVTSSASLSTRRP